MQRGFIRTAGSPGKKTGMPRAALPPCRKIWYYRRRGKTMPVFLYTFIHWTWGILQNLAASLIFLRHIRCRHYRFHGAVVTEWDRDRYMALGMFIFVKKGCREELVVHEYGHTIQSVYLGPLFTLVIGLPSTLWAATPALRTYRQKHQISYYALFCERWANHLGEKYTGKPSMGQVLGG